MDGTLIEAWASHRRFKREDGPPEPARERRNPEVEFRKDKRANATHQSTTDAEARLCLKSEATPTELCYIGHILKGKPASAEFSHPRRASEGRQFSAQLHRAAGSALGR